MLTSNAYMAEFLLARVEVSTTASATNTHSHVAAHKDVVESLLANASEVNVRDDDGDTPLHWAALFDQKAVAELLIASRAEVNAKDKERNTPLRLALIYKHYGMADLLHQHGGQE